MARAAFPSGQVMFLPYPCDVERVQIVEQGAGAIVLRKRVRDPYVVENANGDHFVVSGGDLFNDPVAASIRSAELAEEHDIDCGEEEEDDADAEEEDEDEDEDEDEYQ